jgi:glycopeptide antibiotics resistance protein
VSRNDLVRRPWLGRLLYTLLGAYLLLLTGVVMFKLPFYSPAGDTARVVNLVPLAGSFDGHGGLLWGEIAYNMALFVPLGVYLRTLSRWTLLGQVAATAGLSCGFEVAQYSFALGVADVTDVIDNTLGGAVGMAVAAMLAKLFGGKASIVIAAVALVATVAAGIRFGQLFYLSHISMGNPP